MKTKILLAEDDANFGMMLKIFLEINHYQVVLCENGEVAWKTFQNQNFDVCIFDVMMPILDGFTLGEKITQANKNIPFVFLTAKALKEDQIKGYKIGASDYLIKPFDPEILLLKLGVLSAKLNKDETTKIFQIGNYLFDIEKRLLKINSHEQKLSPKETHLLQLLCEKKDNILTHEEALLKIWKNDDYFTRQSMNVFITHIRKYLSLDTQNQIEIENLHSKGFMLKCEPIV